MSALLSSEVPPPYGVRDKEEQGSWVTQASKQATKQAGERNNVFSLVAGRFVHRRTHPSEDKDKGLCFFACCSFDTPFLSFLHAPYFLKPALFFPSFFPQLFIHSFVRFPFSLD